MQIAYPRAENNKISVKPKVKEPAQSKAKPEAYSPGNHLEVSGTINAAHTQNLAPLSNVSAIESSLMEDVLDFFIPAAGASEPELPSLSRSTDKSESKMLLFSAAAANRRQVVSVPKNQSTAKVVWSAIKGDEESKLEMRRRYPKVAIYADAHQEVQKSSGIAFSRGVTEGVAFNEALLLGSKFSRFSKFVGWSGAGMMVATTLKMAENFERDYSFYGSGFDDVLTNPLLSEVQKTAFWEKEARKERLMRENTPETTTLWDLIKRNPEEVGFAIGSLGSLRNSLSKPKYKNIGSYSAAKNEVQTLFKAGSLEFVELNSLSAEVSIQKGWISNTNAQALYTLARNRIQHESLKTTYRQAMEKPPINNLRLKNFVEEYYRPNAEVGSGSTADAIRRELATGKPTKGKFHEEKCKNTIIFLENWLNNNTLGILEKNNEHLNAHDVVSLLKDRAAVENILLDLKDALGEKQWYSKTIIPK